MADRQLIFDGHTKKVISAENEDFVILEFKDSETVFETEKKAKFKNKGALRVTITTAIFEYLDSYNIPTHLDAVISESQMRVKKLDMLPISVHIRNLAAGNICERFKLEPGTPLKYPVLEYYLKDENLGNPFISKSHAYAFGYATPEEMKHISRLSSKVNAVLKAFMERRQLKLVDYRLEFGRRRGQIVLGDEISPDNARLWHVDDEGKLTQNHFHFENSKAEKSYHEIVERLARR